jgi:hypothetical protein
MRVSYINLALSMIELVTFEKEYIMHETLQKNRFTTGIQLITSFRMYFAEKIPQAASSINQTLPPRLWMFYTPAKSHRYCFEYFRIWEMTAKN